MEGICAILNKKSDERNGNMDFPSLIAHRGLHNEAFPENSMGAFKNAVSHGLAIELDVHLTKDCRLVAFHDSNLERMTGVDAEIEDFTYEQLTALKLKDTEEKIPLLHDVLKEISGKVPLVIEIKEGSPVGILEKRLYTLMKNYKGDWCVMSFNPLRIGWFKKFAPEVVRGMLLSRHKKKLTLNYIKKYITSLTPVHNTLASPDFIAYDLRSVTMDALMDAFSCGCPLLGWTAQNEETLTEALKFCVGVIFENISPERATEISKLEYSEESEQG